ncbi:MAG: glycosyltransferase family 4 protein, partial [Stellaceae bacterium]
ELGVPLAGGRFGRVLLDRRDAALRAADANVVVGEGMAARVRARGVAAERVRVIPNWCDDEEIQPVAPVANPLRREWGLDHHFVVGYSGNLGRAHEIATMLAAAERLRGDQRFKFLFIGGGNGFRDLAAEVRDRRLGHLFAFFPYQDRSRLKFSLGVADVHLISLRPELEGLIVPSKLYGIAAAGRSIVAIAAADGDVARFVQRAGCGVVIAPGAGELLAEALRRLRADPGCVAEMGRRARAALDADFTRRQAFARWRALIEEITAAPPHPVTRAV